MDGLDKLGEEDYILFDGFKIDKPLVDEANRKLFQFLVCRQQVALGAFGEELS